MTEIEKKALALVNEVERDQGYSDLTSRIMRGLIWGEALCRLIEQHEAYKQEVSDALLEYYGGYDNASGETLERFIIPKPTVDPLVDPLIEVLAECDWFDDPTLAADIHEGLAKRGLKIVETFTRSSDM